MSNYIVDYYSSKRIINQRINLSIPMKLKCKMKHGDYVNLPRIYEGSIFLYPFVLNHNKRIVAYYETTLKEYWSYDISIDDILSNITFYDNSMILATQNRILIIDIQNGKLIKEFPSCDFSTKELIVMDGILYGISSLGLGKYYEDFLTGRENLVKDDELEIYDVLYAIDLDYGKILWEYKLDNYIMKNRIALNEEALVVIDDSSLIQLNLKTGKESWRFDASSLGQWKEKLLKAKHAGRPIGTPAIYENRVIAGISAYHMCCFDLKTGELIWDKQVKCNMPGEYSLYSDGKVYLLTQGHYYIFDSRDGEQLFYKYVFDEMCDKGLMGLNGEIAVTEDYLYFTDVRGGKVGAMEKETGKVVWTFQCDNPVPQNYVPVIANGRMYVCDSGGTVYCFEEDK